MILLAKLNTAVCTRFFILDKEMIDVKNKIPSCCEL
jgi:hypothetical protein